MQLLSPARILEVWEKGQGKGPQEQAVLLLWAARPRWPTEHLWYVDVGSRDAEILGLRHRTLGPEIRGSVACTSCTARLRFTLRTDDVRFVDEAEDELPPEPAPLSFAHEGYEVAVRLPTTADLDAVSIYPDGQTARDALLQRCLCEARSPSGAVVRAHELPPSVVKALGDELNERSPQTDVELELTCASCGHAWKALFDVAAFFWTEIGVVARRLVHDVHALATAYGWREADILAMSGARRRLYLEQIAP